MVGGIVQGHQYHWRFTGHIWHNWELNREGVIVASLKSKRFFGLSFEGSFEDYQITIRKALDGSVQICDIESGKLIASLNRADILPISLTTSNGMQYKIIEPELGDEFVLQDNQGNVLAITKFNLPKGLSTGPSASFRTADTILDEPNPWLVAVICLYVAISNSYSNPA